ncbi:MAG TPA: hypothetical protein VIL46_04655 [Gemmataceae bacterium]
MTQKGADASGAGGAADSLLVEQVRQVCQAPTREERCRALDRLAQTVREGETGRAVLTRLLAADPAAQRLAMELVLRLPLPVEPPLVERFRDLLGDGRFPEALRMAVAGHLLCSVEPAGPEAREVLLRLTKELPGGSALNRLHQLRGRVIGCDALDEMCARLEARVPMSCPRCPARLPRPELVKHLWQEHRLMLDGQRVREPWKLIEEWLEEYAATGRAELLDRSSELAEQLDPREGAVRVQRMLLRDGRGDEGVLADLREEARRRSATLCPACYALVPEPPERPVPPVTVSGGRLAGRGFRVEVSDTGLRTRLCVRTPKGTICRGPEPCWRLTARGMTLVAVAPLVLAALLLAVLLPQPVPWVVGLLGIALFLTVYIRGLARAAPPPEKRAIGYAWARVVPELHRDGYSLPEGDFLSGLAQVSVGTGSPAARDRPLAEAAKKTREAVAARQAPLEHLVALRRLEIADAAALGRDPVLILVNDLGGCLTGELPLDYAELLLKDWAGQEWWTRGNRARLRVLLCARAFEAGLGVWELHELGKVAARLGEACGAEDIDGLARLRHLWTLKPSRAWRAFGHATPVFDLARFPILGGQHLQDRPDLLLFQPTSNGEDEPGPSAPVLVCEEGVAYRDALLTCDDLPVRVRTRPIWQGGGFELTAGSFRKQFRSDPSLLARRLEGWLTYLYRHFLPKVDSELARHAPGKLAAVLRQKMAYCPECGQPFLRRRHDVGMRVEVRGAPEGAGGQGG